MSTPSPLPTFTRAGAMRGIVMALPLLPGVLVFAAAVGTLGAQKGLSLWAVVAQSAFVYAGASQLVSLEMWQEHWTFASLLTLAGVTAAVNSRMLLMSAALRPWLGGMQGAHVYPPMFLLTDASWAIGLRHYYEGGRDYGVLIGSGIFLYIIWVAATVPGYFVGSLIADPKVYALDLIMVFVFTTMAVPVLKRSPRVLPFAMAAGIGVAASVFLPGYWFIVLGALAGAFTAAVMEPA